MSLCSSKFAFDFGCHIVDDVVPELSSTANSTSRSNECHFCFDLNSSVCSFELDVNTAIALDAVSHFMSTSISCSSWGLFDFVFDVNIVFCLVFKKSVRVRCRCRGAFNCVFVVDLCRC